MTLAERRAGVDWILGLRYPIWHPVRAYCVSSFHELIFFTHGGQSWCLELITTTISATGLWRMIWVSIRVTSTRISTTAFAAAVLSDLPVITIANRIIIAVPLIISRSRAPDWGNNYKYNAQHQNKDAYCRKSNHNPFVRRVLLLILISIVICFVIKEVTAVFVVAFPNITSKFAPALMLFNVEIVIFLLDCETTCCLH